MRFSVQILITPGLLAPGDLILIDKQGRLQNELKLVADLRSYFIFHLRAYLLTRSKRLSSELASEGRL